MSTLSGWPGTRTWMAQRTKVDPNKTVQEKKINEMIHNYIQL